MKCIKPRCPYIPSEIGIQRKEKNIVKELNALYIYNITNKEIKYI